MVLPSCHTCQPGLVDAGSLLWQRTTSRVFGLCFLTYGQLVAAARDAESARRCHAVNCWLEEAQAVAPAEAGWPACALLLPKGCCCCARRNR